MQCIVFDTFAGLCNQMYDIETSIHFCEFYQIPFTFRYCSFRDPKNIKRFYNVPFEELFDTNFISSRTNLFIPYIQIKDFMNQQNTFNFENKRIVQLWRHLPKNFISIVRQLQTRYKFIILRQFWVLETIERHSKWIDIRKWIEPCFKIKKIYLEIKSQLKLETGTYHFLHYRHEIDFVQHFKLFGKIESLPKILERLYSPKDRIYIASTNIYSLLHNYGNPKMFELFYKNDTILKEFNFEECAFIDFLFGYDAKSVYGHYNSSFSRVLNSIHNSDNYYTK